MCNAVRRVPTCIARLTRNTNHIIWKNKKSHNIIFFYVMASYEEHLYIYNLLLNYLPPNNTTNRRPLLHSQQLEERILLHIILTYI